MKLITGLTLINASVLLLNVYFYVTPHKTTINTPTRYDIAVKCQELTAEAMGDSYKDDNGKVVTFGYKSCVDELTKAVNYSTIKAL